jgi:hypothetical protein
MGKLLRVVVFVILILSGVALYFGIVLFGKREQLKGRAQELGAAITQLGPVIEKDPPSEVPAKPVVARDIDDCKAEVLESPKRSDFWNSYRIELEVTELPTLKINGDTLKCYYKVGFDGKPEKDPMTGMYVTKGDGTLQGLLDDLQKKAMDQYNRLNETRAQLKSLRAEYSATIEDVNAQKKTLREKLLVIVGLESDIKKLQDNIAQLEAKIKDLESQIASLKADIEEKAKQIEKLNETIATKDADIARLDRDLKKAIGGKTGAEIEYSGNRVEPGQKGTVCAVDGRWNFVVFQTTDSFMKEVLGQNMDQTVPKGLDLMVRRPGGNQFVTKVRVMSIRKNDKLVVADVLQPWQRATVSEGDVVYY